MPNRGFPSVIIIQKNFYVITVWIVGHWIVIEHTVIDGDAVCAKERIVFVLEDFPNGIENET